MSARAFMAAAALLAGCSRTVVVPISIDPPGFDYGFLTVLDAAGKPTHSFPVFGPGVGELPHTELAPADAEVVLVGVSRADLSSALPAFTATRAAELALVEGDACEEGTVLPGGTRARVRVPATAAVRAAPVPAEGAIQLAAKQRSEVPFLAGRVIEAPIDLERCLSEAPIALAPFAGPGRERILPRPLSLEGERRSDATHADLVRALRLEDGTVLAAAREAFYLFEPGAPFVPRAGNHLLHEDGPPEDRERVGDLAVERPAPPGGRPRMAVAVTLTDRRGGSVVDLDLGPDGLRYAGTPTRTVSLKSVAITPAGEVIAVGFDGVVLVRRARGEPFTRQRFTEIRDAGVLARLVRVVTGPAPDAAVIIASEEGTIWTGPSPRGPWSVSSAGRAMLGDSRIFTVAAFARADGVVLYSAGNDGTLFRKPPGRDWEQVPLDAPPSYALCARLADACGRTPPGYWVTSMVAVPATATGEPRLLMSTAQCHGALLYRPRDGCAAGAHLSTRALEPSADDPLSLDAFEGRLTVSSDGGKLYSLDVVP